MRPTFLAVVLAALVLPGCTDTRGAKRNVVLVVVDAMRADRVASKAYPLPTTPFLSGLARHAVLFDRAYAQAPWTNSSVASLFTALDPSTHRVMTLVRDEAGTSVPDSLSEAAMTLAEVLRDQGYDTAMVSANPWLAGGLAQGFDIAQFLEATARASDVNVVAQAILEAASKRRQPLFLYLHYMDLHGPYRNPPPPAGDLFTDYYRSLGPRRLSEDEKRQYGFIHEALPTEDLREYLIRYDRSIRYVDEQLESLWDAMASFGLKEETIFIVTADHGEAFLEHGQPAHGRGVHQEQTRVPLLWWQAGGLVPGSVDDVVQLEDVFPTLLEVLRLETPSTFAPDGRSFAPLLARESAGTVRTAWSENHIRDLHQVALVDDGFKWHYDLDRQTLVEVYDPSNDTVEKKNLLNDMAEERLQRVTARIRLRLAEDERKGRQGGLFIGKPEIPEDRRKELKALGYLD